jgi:hypothetical protein
MNDSNGQPPANGHALSVDRVIDAEPEAIRLSGLKRHAGVRRPPPPAHRSL